MTDKTRRVNNAGKTPEPIARRDGARVPAARLLLREGAWSLMSSVVYAGMDLADVCSVQVVGRSVNELAVEAMWVAGRQGT